MSKPEFYYVMLIEASREKVWDALTNGEFTKQYWHQTRVQSDWNKGSRIEFWVEGDSGPVVGCAGEILIADEPSALSYTWHFPLNPACAGEAPSRVTFSLEDVGGATKLIVCHDSFEDEDSATYHMVRDGWPYVLCGLKSLCERGQTVDFSLLEAS